MTSRKTENKSLIPIILIIVLGLSIIFVFFSFTSDWVSLKDYGEEFCHNTTLLFIENGLANQCIYNGWDETCTENTNIAEE